MTANLDKPNRWKADVDASVDFYNAWLMRFAPETFRGQRASQAGLAATMLEATNGLRDMTEAWFAERGCGTRRTCDVGMTRTGSSAWFGFDVMPFGEPPLCNVEAFVSGTSARAGAYRRKVQMWTSRTAVPRKVLLCGAFDPGFLGLLASGGLDWGWMHRPADLIEKDALV